MTRSADGMIACADDRRSGVLRNRAHPLNGIDFVEYRRNPTAPPGQQFALIVAMLKPPPTAPALTAADAAVLGGVRIVAVNVIAVAPDALNPLHVIVFLDREGDFSTYALRLAHPEIDDERSEARFGFKASCPTEFDCRVDLECPADTPPEPALDYLAKDYQSFRRLLTDLIAERNPGWRERLPADLGMTLVELLAYAGDYLSYYQDAWIATEGYLDTCQHRISASRHARLIDYRMHQGRNAWTYVHFRAEAGTSGVVPASAKLVTRIGRPLIGASTPPPTLIPATADFDGDPALIGATVFETTSLVRVIAAHNELRIHAWDDALCCLGAGSTEAFLYGLNADGAGGAAFRPALAAGDFLLIEEVLSPVTGIAADANAAHRQVVRLIAVEDTEDRAFTDAVGPGGALVPRLNPADPALPLQKLVWGDVDALKRSVCLSAETDTGTPIHPVSVARGNVTPIDHGRSRFLDSDRGEIVLPDAGAGRWPLPTLSLSPEIAPLTQTAMPDTPAHDDLGRLLLGRFDLARAARDCGPQCALVLDLPGVREVWSPVPHLLDSTPDDQHFVAEIDNDGAVQLRFGDDEYGRRPLGATRARVRLRVGNGRAGNLGAGALVHLVHPDPADPLDPAEPSALLTFAAVERVYQPLAARDASDPESIAEVRALAPEAFRAVQFRAVTEADWVEMAMRHPDIAGARATFRWTGSWHTVFVAVQPRSEAMLRRLPGGGRELEPGFAQRITRYLRRFKLAGYDLVVRAAVYVPLEIDIRICVARGHHRGDVLAAVARVLSARDHAVGPRGFFNHLAFAFGEPVYLSRLYAAVEAVAGVDSAAVTRFKRYWTVAGDALARGAIALTAFEIARLENDPDHAEDGVLRLTAVGGR